MKACPSTKPFRKLAWSAILPLMLASLLISSSVKAQNDASLALLPSPLDIDDMPAALSVDIYDAPAFTSFTLELSYPSDSLRITAAEAGALVAAPGESIEILDVAPGRLRIGYSQGLSETDAAAEGEDDAAIDDEETSLASLPQGNGTLAVFTVAPIAQTEGLVSIEIVEASIVDADGEQVELSSTTGQASVASEPDQEQIDAYIAQADAMVVSTPDSGLGLGRTIRTAYRDLGRRFDSLDAGPQAMWLGLLALGLLAVGLGWQFGRQPPQGPAPAGSRDDKGDLHT